MTVGARADLLLLNLEDPALAGLDNNHLLDGVVFAAAAQPFLRTRVAGVWAPPPDHSVRQRAALALQQLQR